MKFSSLLLALLLFSSTAPAQDLPPARSTLSPEQAARIVTRAVSSSGVTLSAEMEAPPGYFGFLGHFRGRQLPVYLLPDGQHIVVGTLLDRDGNDLTSLAVRKASQARLGPTQWDMLGKSSWVAEGKSGARRIVYVFVDTRCPYCHKFWQRYQPYLDNGEVQVRNIIVAVISPHSLPEAASILAAADPSGAWNALERRFGQHPDPDPKAGTRDARMQVLSNNALMQTLGFQGTPAIVYKDAKGKVRALSGMPQDDATMQALFGALPEKR